ncbi:MAG TPA: hypothetical protein VEK11_08985 [Thermoanaerobaculia bacterium]|nr:hypothetical protein [Thermoanaerobaculia bacterium]
MLQLSFIFIAAAVFIVVERGSLEEAAWFNVFAAIGEIAAHRTPAKVHAQIVKPGVGS